MYSPFAKFNSAIMVLVEVMNHGNYPPTHNPNLEFSDEKQKIIK